MQTLSPMNAESLTNLDNSLNSGVTVLIDVFQGSGFSDLYYRVEKSLMVVRITDASDQVLWGWL